MPAALIAWLNKTFKFLSMLIRGHYPTGFLMLVYLLEIDSPLVAPMPIGSPGYLHRAANISLHSILLGVGGIIYSPYNSAPLKYL